MLPPHPVPLSQCIAHNKEGFRCGNSAMKGESYCMVHNEKFKEAVRISALTASEAHSANNKLIKKGSINSIEDVIALQSRILSQLARKPNLSTKELLVFNSLSTNYIKNKMEAEKMKRLVELEKKTKHI